MDDRVLRATAVAYGVAFVVHTADHLRRGVDASPRSILVLGALAGVFQVLAITAALTRHRKAALLAVAVGLPDAVGIFTAHLLPRWSGPSDSFPSHAPGVTAFSWVTAVAELIAALAFAYAGWLVMRRGPAPDVGNRASA
jgi:hypothetical protein